jgi:hypothetical protein
MEQGGNEKLLLDAVPLDDAGEYEIPEPRSLEQLETYVPSCIALLDVLLTSIGLQVPNIRFLAQLVASDPSFTAVATSATTPVKAATAATIPEAVPNLPQAKS